MTQMGLQSGGDLPCKRKRNGYIERNMNVEGIENLGYHW